LIANEEDIQVIEGLKLAKSKYVSKDYQGAIESADNLLPICCNKRLLSEIHLFIAKCHKGLEDIKSAITSCNSSIDQYSRWKDPFLYRSACFQVTELYHPSQCDIFKPNFQTAYSKHIFFLAYSRMTYSNLIKCLPFNII
jgi:hypothetical protein